MMGVALLLFGLGLVLTGALCAKAAKQRVDAPSLLLVGRVGLGLGVVFALVGMCVAVVTL
jgi:hypothetical protein